MRECHERDTLHMERVSAYRGRRRREATSVNTCSERDIAAMAEQQISVNRTLVGVIAGACLVTGVAIGFVDDFANLWCAAFVRVGLVMAALWVALPTRERDAAWANVSPITLIAILVFALVFVRRPLVFLPILVAVAAIGFFVRPRRSSRPRPPRSRDTRDV